MSSSKRPTQKQVSLLQRWGLPILPSRAACSMVIGFVFTDKPRKGWTNERKVKIIKEAMQRFLGQYVRQRGTERVGWVEYIVPKEDALHWVEMARNFCDDSEEMCRALVRWDGHNGRVKSYMSLSGLEIIGCISNSEMSGGKSVAIPL